MVVKYGWGIVILAFLVVILLVFTIVAAQALIFMLAWNYVVPAMFSLPEMTYSSALASVIIINIIGAAFKTSVSMSR